MCVSVGGYVRVCVWVCARECSAHGGQKLASEYQELELRAVMNSLQALTTHSLRWCVVDLPRGTRVCSGWQ